MAHVLMATWIKLPSHELWHFVSYEDTGVTAHSGINVKLLLPEETGSNTCLLSNRCMFIARHQDAYTSHSNDFSWMDSHSNQTSHKHRNHWLNTTFSPLWVAIIWGNKYLHFYHCRDVIMGAISPQITSLTIVYSTVYSDADQRKHQSSASLAFLWGTLQGPVNSPHKLPVTRKMFPFDDVIMFLPDVTGTWRWNPPHRRQDSFILCSQYHGFWRLGNASYCLNFPILFRPRYRKC